MRITMSELISIIGSLFVENTMLRKQIEELRAQLAKNGGGEETERTQAAVTDELIL